MGHLHFLDLLVIAGYFALIVGLGRRASRKAGNQGEEGFFLAGRKLGKLYQFVLNFGNTTDANNAVSTASLTYQQGAAGAWLSFQMVFMNPYFWFMNLWFRRVRLVTMGDLLEQRMNSRRLAQFYALVQVLVAVIITIGFGNLVTYKISTAVVVKPESAWTVQERASVEDYRSWRTLEATAATGVLDPLQQKQLGVLRERAARNELRDSISPFAPLPFYCLYTLVIAAYILKGGMTATAVNEMVQCILIVIFSCMLLPVGLHAIGGFGELAHRLPPAMFDFFGTAGVGQVTGLTVAAVFFVSWVQITGIMGNMTIAGSARSEFSARFGAVSGTYAKRLMVIMWSFCGLVAYALYAGGLADPDMVWGAMSRDLLGPGLLGLMLAGVLAANMSSVAAQAMSASAIAVRTLIRPFRPAMSEAEAVTAGRWALVFLLVLGIAAALLAEDVFTFFQLMLTINVPFGAAVFLMFFWRRLTLPAVWLAVVLSTLVNIVGPLVLARAEAVQLHPSLTVRAADVSGHLQPVYFESVARVNPADPTSALEGRTRFHTELYLLSLAGVPVEKLSPSHRLAVRFFFDGLLPFALLIGVSLFTRPPPAASLDQFFGKMKTPVAADPTADAAVMAETIRDPRRFDHQKLFPASSWEFTKWNRVDTLGFLTCLGISGGIILLFWALLRLAAP
jgi:SSS family solute:Na+ symporter